MSDAILKVEKNFTLYCFVNFVTRFFIIFAKKYHAVNYNAIVIAHDVVKHLGIIVSQLLK